VRRLILSVGLSIDPVAAAAINHAGAMEDDTTETFVVDIGARQLHAILGTMRTISVIQRSGGVRSSSKAAKRCAQRRPRRNAAASYDEPTRDTGRAAIGSEPQREPRNPIAEKSKRNILRVRPLDKFRSRIISSNLRRH
jgi:hypothetical protein